MVLGLDVLPEYRGQRLAREIMSRYLERERVKGRCKVILTCLKSKVSMYEKMGFQNDGISGSVWGRRTVVSDELRAEWRKVIDNKTRHTAVVFFAV